MPFVINTAEKRQIARFISDHVWNNPKLRKFLPKTMMEVKEPQPVDVPIYEKPEAKEEAREVEAVEVVEAENNPADMTLKELRASYPEITARSKEEFLSQI